MNVPSSMILISPFVMLCCRSLFSLSSFMSWPILVTLSLMFNIVSACWMLIEVSAAWSLLLHLSSRESSVFPSITPCWGRCQVCWEQSAEDGHVTANMLKCKQLFGSIVVLCDRQMGKEWYICSNQMRNMCWLLLSISQLRMKMGRAVGFAVDIYKTQVGLFTVNLAMSIVSLWSVVYALFRFSVL